MAQTFLMTIDSDVNRLGEVAEFVERAARACGLNDDQLYDVQMAIDEAVTNVIEHAYRAKPDGEIHIECAKRGGDFVVTIRDHGERFDPKQVAQPKTRAGLSERNIGGLGLFFMKKLMNKVEFQFSEEQGNTLTMVKKIKK
ncbi:MAG: ATP-binding protein [Chloroflexi bacterium]|nr:ATP-binding protein [Chloroflexota bacterium]